MNKISLFFLLLFMPVLVSSVVYGANAYKEIEEMGQLIGYSAMCAELADMKDMTQRESEESRLFGQKFMKQYKSLGAQAANIFMENIHLGLAAGGMDKGANCAIVLNRVIETSKSLGLSGGYWQRILDSKKFQTNRKIAQADNTAKKPAPGLYRAAGSEGEIADIILRSDGSGSFEIEEDSNPFTWKMQEDKLMINMLDTSLPPEHRTYEAGLKNDNFLVMDDLTYQREKDIKIETYEYLEKGFSGALYLTDWDSKGEQVNIKIATVNDVSTNTCDAEATCKSNGTMLLCKDSNSEDPEAILTIKIENKDILLVDGTLSRSEYCGNSGDFFGKYKLIP